jgi:acetoin utilization deacetylase AcuC-like enzyme
MMKAVLDARQIVHDPKHSLLNGKAIQCREQPERIDVLHKAAVVAGCEFSVPSDHGCAPLAAIHSPEYLTFLETIHQRWSRLKDASNEVIPNIHPANRNCSYPSGPVGQAGYHQADTACPITAGTWEAAYWSAQTALSAADLIMEGAKATYALCRPPGHHAFGDMAGGFCYLNNAAIAAQYFLHAGFRLAILDIDVHHGNGTQGIFYDRDDILTTSIHGDPANFYPFFWGHAAERGTGRGLGYNLNIPLPFGTDDAAFLIALETALQRISANGTDILVVSVGLDPHEGDPFEAFKVTTSGFAKIGAAISALGLPTLYVQEGGYLQPALGDNLTSFLSGVQG